MYNEQASLLATFQLQSDSAIQHLFISDNEQVLVVSYQSGQISAYDIKQSFNLIGDI